MPKQPYTQKKKMKKSNIIKKFIKIFVPAILLLKLFLYLYTPNELIVTSNLSINSENEKPYKFEIFINDELMDTIQFNDLNMRIIDYERQYKPISHLYIVNKISGISDDIYFNDFLSKWIVIEVYKDGFSFHRHWFPPFFAIDGYKLR